MLKIIIRILEEQSGIPVEMEFFQVPVE